MRSALLDVLEKADLVAATLDQLVVPTEREHFAAAVRDVRARLSYPDDMVVACLAGGTGSGKSSIFNSIAGSELVDVGGVRPTTSSATAVVSPDRLDRVENYMAELNVEVIVAEGMPKNLCLIDLPDTDSVVAEHRLEVDRLLPRLDIVIWVADPEKYRDESLHGHYLAPAVDYGSQFLFVLNQIDRLTEADRPLIHADFEAALVQDGFVDPQILMTAADPGVGPPMYVEEITKFTLDAVGGGVAIYFKLLTDLEVSGRDLLRSVGDPVEFDEKSQHVVESAVDLLVEAQPQQAVEVCVGFLEDLAESCGGMTGVGLQELAVSVPVVVNDIHQTTKPPPVVKGRWWGRDTRDSTDYNHKDRLRRQLVDRIFGPARGLVESRARTMGLMTDLMLTLTSLSVGGPR